MHALVAQLLSRVQLFATHGLYPARLLCPWGSPGKNTGVDLPCPPPGDLPRDPGIKPVSLALAGKFFITAPLGKPPASPHHTIT